MHSSKKLALLLQKNQEKNALEDISSSFQKLEDDLQIMMDLSLKLEKIYHGLHEKEYAKLS